MRYIFVLIFFFFTTIAFAQGLHKQSFFDVKFYKLDLRVSNKSTYVEGNTHIKCQLLNNTDTLIFDLGMQLSVDSVLVNGKKSTFNHRNDYLFIHTGFSAVNDFIDIVIYYKGDGNAVDYEGALYNRSYKDYGDFTYSLTEPYSSKYWYPTKQILTDKADSVFVYLTVPRNTKAGSNGVLVDIIEVNDTLVQYQWESRYPTAFYLVSMAVGNYQEYTFYSDFEDVYSEMPVVNYIYNSDDYLSNNRSEIDTTDDLLKLFSDIFIPYPFHKEKYGHCTAPMGGGMEHQTMTTLVNFNFDLVAHELAHQWFGNYVTCKTWNDIWINEGFASYCEYLAHELLGDLNGAQAWMEYAQDLALRSDVGSIFVPDDELDLTSRIFDYKSTYKKGAAILHMLRYQIDEDELFFDILREFLLFNAYGNGSVSDFINVLNNLTGTSYDWFFDQWYYGAGYPVFSIDWYQRNDSVHIGVVQEATEPQATPFFKTDLDIKLIGPTGDTTVRVALNSFGNSYTIKTDLLVYDLIIDPDNFLLNDVERVRRVDSLMTGKRPDILVYPNPTSDSVKLFSTSIATYATVTLMTIDGKMVKDFIDVDLHGGVIPLHDLETGLYLLNIEVGSLNTVIKLIKS